MAYTPIPKQAPDWDVPLNAALVDQDARITANTSSIAAITTDLDTKVEKSGDTMTGALVINKFGEDPGYPIGQAGAVNSMDILSTFAGGEDEGQPGQFDSTGRLNLYSYQRADVQSYGETIRHFAMRKDSKQMEAWYFPDGGYDVNREPVGNFKPVVWTGAHWEANNHASNHKHWSVETPSSTGSIETRFEVRFGDPLVDNAIAGLDKTLIATNLADFVVRCTNGQEMRLTSPDAQEKKIVFSRDPEGADQWRRWVIRSTSEPETGSNAGSNFQIGRYDDAGVFQDNPLVVSRSTGNVTLTPGVVARRATASVSNLTLNTASLGGGVGVVGVADANTVPASNPTAGVALYSEGGTLKYRGGAGVVNFAQIATNTANIATNTTNIATNTTDIATLDTRVDATESDILDLAVTGFQPDEYGYASWTQDPATLSLQSTLSTGVIYYMAIKVLKNVTIDTINICFSTAATTSTAGCFVGIYTSSGTRLGQSADQAATWGGTAAFRAVPLTSSVALTPAYYYVAVLWNGTGSPGLPAGGNTAGGFSPVINTNAPVVRSAQSAAGQTSLPASIGSFSSQTQNVKWASIQV